MREGDTLVFVEVRYRDASASADGSDSIGPAKQRKLVRTAEMFLSAHPDFSNYTCRFDSVAFSGLEAAPQCRWEQGAFEAF